MSSAVARALGTASEPLRSFEAKVVQRGVLVEGLPTEGRAVVGGGEPDCEYRAVPDGNRSATLPEVRAIYAGREWMLSIKGVGAGSPAYGATPIDDAFANDFAPGLSSLLCSRTVAGESWMGESAYGAQGTVGAAQALEVTSLLDERGTIGGAFVCPIAAIVELPERAVARDVFWYRRHEGPVLQEHRLVPSDVRLFHGPGCSLARDPEGVLRGFGVEDVAPLDAFVDRYLASGIAAMTLWARSARVHRGVLEGLDLDDAWLDKDSLLAPDGTLMLVDLESIDWAPVTHRMDARARIRRQIDRNHYELFYGLDALLDVRDRWLDRRSDPRARRESLAARIAVALTGDTWVQVVEGDTIDLEVRGPEEPVRVRFLDRR